MDYTEAFAAVDKNEAYIVDILQKLIRIDTTVPPGKNYGVLCDLVEPEFQRFGFETKRVIVPDEKVRLIPGDMEGERINLVASLHNGKPAVSAYAHMDVVPADGNWTQDPFGGDRVENKIYGRGTVDMKGGIACFLGAIKVLHEMGLEPHYAINCCLCTDEEVGVYPGARYLAEEGYFSNHLMWLELGAMEPVVTIGAAGCVRIDLKAIGESCHSGMNYLGVNAIEELIPVLNELMELKREVEQRLSRIPTFPLPGCPFDKMTPMFNLNIVRGGMKENIVPAECDLVINRRYIIDENYNDIIAEIESAVKRGREKSKLLDLKMTVVQAYPPVEIDPDSPAAKKMKSAMQAVKGYEEFIYGGISGSTDMGFVAQALQPETIDVAGFGLIRAGNILAHAADEFVFVEDLVDMTKELVHYMAY